MIIAKRLWILALAAACGSRPSEEPVQGSGTAVPARADAGAGSSALGPDGRPGWVTDELIAAVERPLTITSDLGERLEEAGADCRRATAAVIAAVGQYGKVRAELDRISRALDFGGKPAAEKAWLSKRIAGVKRREIDKARFKVYAVACKNDLEHRRALERLPKETRMVLAAAASFAPPPSVTPEMQATLKRIVDHMTRLAGELAEVRGDCAKAAERIRASATPAAGELAEAIKPLRAANEDVRTWFALNYFSIDVVVPTELQTKCKDPAFRAAFDAHPLR